MTSLLTKPEAIHRNAIDSDYSVFVECLATRNNGDMHGFWVDLEFIETSDDWDQVTAFLFATSDQPNAEEYEITDHQIPQFVATGSICDMIAFTQIGSSFHGYTEEAYWTYCIHTCKVSDAVEFEDAFLGFYSSETDFCYDTAEEQGLISGHYCQYIDWDQVWEGEYNCNGHWSESIRGGVAIFQGV
jgi:antirestriction protein